MVKNCCILCKTRHGPPTMDEECGGDAALQYGNSYERPIDLGASNFEGEIHFLHHFLQSAPGHVDDSFSLVSYGPESKGAHLRYVMTMCWQGTELIEMGITNPPTTSRIRKYHEGIFHRRQNSWRYTHFVWRYPCNQFLTSLSRVVVSYNT